MHASHLEVLVEYHAWANQRLFDTAALVPAELLASGELSQGSVLASLRHVLDVSQSWRAAAAGERGWTVEEMDQLGDLASLRAFALEEHERLLAFVRSLDDADLERDVVPSWKDRPFKVWQIVMHIVTHQIEHGNEIGWELTRLGHSPGELAFMGWVDLVQRARE